MKSKRWLFFRWILSAIVLHLPFVQCFSTFIAQSPVVCYTLVIIFSKGRECTVINPFVYAFYSCEVFLLNIVVRITAWQANYPNLLPCICSLVNNKLSSILAFAIQRWQDKSLFKPSSAVWTQAIINTFARNTGSNQERINVLCLKPKGFLYRPFY